jgi:prevent-host-death family protein
MEMSVREARAQFAHALAAAERGERVTITKNGEPVAEIGPVRGKGLNIFERLERAERELGFDTMVPPRDLDEQWRREFDDPAWTREIFGADYDDDEPSER